MKVYTLLLCTAALSVGACSGTDTRYTPRPDVQKQNYTQKHHAQDRDDKQAYENYEKREQCQHYRQSPRHYDNPCTKREDQPQEPVWHKHTLLFDYDKSALRPEAESTLDQLARDIKQYEAQEVRVTGHTDRAGSNAYNHKLSHERTQAVANALRARGIDDNIITRKGRGENDSAVTTDNGVMNQANRRVIVEILRRTNEERKD